MNKGYLRRKHSMEIRKDPKKMTEHELRTEVIKRRAEVNRLRKVIFKSIELFEEVK